MGPSNRGGSNRALILGALAAALAASCFATPAQAAPAAPTITARPPSPNSSRAPSWSFSAEAGVSFECRLSRGASVVDGWEACVSPQGFALAGQPDSVFTFEVRALDAFGLAGPVGSSAYVLDTTSPEAPVLTQMPPTIGAGSAPVWSFAAAPEETVIYDSAQSPLPLSVASIAYAARSTAEVGELVSFTGTKRYATAATVVMSDWARHSQWPEYPAGGWQLPITFNVYSVDRSGAEPQPGVLLGSVTQTFTIPWRPEADPTCPAESVFQPWRSPDGVCRTNIASTVTFDLSALDLVLPAEAIYGVAFDTDGHGAEPLSQPGPYDELNLGMNGAPPTAGSEVEAGVLYFNSTFGGFYADGGKGGTGTFRRDTGWSAEPAIGLLAGEPPEPAPVTECRLTRGETTVYEWAPCAPPVSYDLSTQPDGTYTLAVRETDAAGNSSPAATASYTLDRAAPPAPVITRRPSSPSSARTLSWSFNGEAGARLECRLADTALVAGEWSGCASPVDFALTGAPDGTYRFEVRARNALGTTGEAAADDHVLDTTAPAPPVITRAPPSPSGNRAPAWTFTAERGTLLECRLQRPGAIVADWGACASPRRYELAGAPLGRYGFAVRARDAAGNESAPSFSTYQLEKPVSAGPKAGSHPPRRKGSGPGAGRPSGGSKPSTPAGATLAPTATPRGAQGALSASAPAQAAPPKSELRRMRTAHARGHTRPRSPTSAARSAAKASPRRGVGSWLGGALTAIAHALAAFGSAVLHHPDKSFFPLSLILLVAGFLMLQGRIDKSDPKLALAPVYPDPDLEFSSPSASPA